MRLRSPARRLLLICVLALVAGYVSTDVAPVLLALWRTWGPTLCGTADSATTLCRLAATGLPQVAAAALTLLALSVACWGAIRWGLRPIRELVPAVAAVGPQNLGHRIGPGPGGDELAGLARAIDDMMDRIAAGYEAQRRFAADASHELRTPLAVQRTLIEVGMARELTPDMVTLLTAQLLETNERNERLVEGLLVLAESDRGLVTRTPQRLDEIVASVLSDQRVRAADAGVTVTTGLSPRTVPGERVLLERLVTNLVQNAIRYNRPGGTIEVRVGDRPALLVRNTGDDVPPDAVAGLFEPFRRLAGTRLGGGGAGLGLAIARSIVQAHDGLIAAHSTGRDGLCVEVTLPETTVDRGR